MNASSARISKILAFAAGAPLGYRGCAPYRADGEDVGASQVKRFKVGITAAYNGDNLADALWSNGIGQNIGYIFQTHHLLGGFTALENVQLGMSFTGRRVDVGWATHLLTAVGLADRMPYKPGKLSVGQQQRVAVARALANRPLLVLADEPTGALDPANAQQVLDLIRTLCTEVGASLLLVTHDMTIANQLPRQVMLGELNQPQVK